MSPRPQTGQLYMECYCPGVSLQPWHTVLPCLPTASKTDLDDLLAAPVLTQSSIGLDQWDGGEILTTQLCSATCSPHRNEELIQNKALKGKDATTQCTSPKCYGTGSSGLTNRWCHNIVAAFPLVGRRQNKTRASHQSKTQKRSINTEVFCFWWKRFAFLHPPLRLRMWLFIAFGLFIERFWLIPNPSTRPPPLCVAFTSVSGLSVRMHAQFFECLQWYRGCWRIPLQVATCSSLLLCDK